MEKNGKEKQEVKLPSLPCQLRKQRQDKSAESRINFKLPEIDQTSQLIPVNRNREEEEDIEIGVTRSEDDGTQNPEVDEITDPFALFGDLTGKTIFFGPYVNVGFHKRDVTPTKAINHKVSETFSVDVGDQDSEIIFWGQSINSRRPHFEQDETHLEKRWLKTCESLARVDSRFHPQKTSLIYPDPRRILAIQDKCISDLRLSFAIPFVRFGVNPDLDVILNEHKSLLGQCTHHLDWRDAKERFLSLKYSSASALSLALREMDEEKKLQDLCDKLKKNSRQFLQFLNQNEDEQVVSSTNKATRRLSSSAQFFIKCTETFLRIVGESLQKTPADVKEATIYGMTIFETLKKQEEEAARLSSELEQQQESSKRVLKRLDDAVEKCEQRLWATDSGRTKTFKEKELESKLKLSKIQNESKVLKEQLEESAKSYKQAKDIFQLENKNREAKLRQNKYKTEVELQNWKEVYDKDMEKLDTDWELLMEEYAPIKKALEKMETDIAPLHVKLEKVLAKRRQEVKEREAAKNELMRMNKCAARVQAFWRGMYVQKKKAMRKKKLEK